MKNDILPHIKKQFNRVNILHIILLSLFLRITWLWISEPVPVSDFAEYKQLAINLIAHHQFGYPIPTAYRLPGYPIFLALFSLISQSDIWLGIINILLSTVIVYFVYLLAIRLTLNKSIGMLAGFIAGIYPIFIFFSPVLASEHLFTVLFYGGLLLLLTTGADKKQYTIRLLAGILFGFATLTRGEAIYYLPVILLLALLPDMNQARAHGVKITNSKILSSLILFIAWGAVILPWYIRNQIVIGEGSGLGTSGGIMFYYGHHDERLDWPKLLSADNIGTGEITRSANAFRKGLDYVLHTPFSSQLVDKVIESLRLYAPNAYPVFWSAAIPIGNGRFSEKPLAGLPVYSLLAITGYLFVGSLALSSLFFLRQFTAKLWIVVLGVALLNLFGYAILFAATSRYRYTIEGLLCILAACATWNLAGLLTRNRYPFR